MKKKYSVEENKKIENGKSRIVNINTSDTDKGVVVVSGETGDCEVEEFLAGTLPDKEEVDQPVKTFGSSVVDAPERLAPFRPVEPKDIIYDNIIQIKSDKYPYAVDVRIVTVLNPSDSLRTFLGNDGKVYGTENAFIRVRK